MILISSSFTTSTHPSSSMTCLRYSLIPLTNARHSKSSSTMCLLGCFMYFTASPPPFTHIVAQSGGKDECADANLRMQGCKKCRWFCILENERKTKKSGKNKRKIEIYTARMQGCNSVSPPPFLCNQCDFISLDRVIFQSSVAGNSTVRNAEITLL